jgi:hypothetical protein
VILLILNKVSVFSSTQFLHHASLFGNISLISPLQDTQFHDQLSAQIPAHNEHLWFSSLEVIAQIIPRRLSRVILQNVSNHKSTHQSRTPNFKAFHLQKDGALAATNIKPSEETETLREGRGR